MMWPVDRHDPLTWPLCDHERDWHLIGLWLNCCGTVVFPVTRTMPRMCESTSATSIANVFNISQKVPYTSIHMKQWFSWGVLKIWSFSEGPPKYKGFSEVPQNKIAFVRGPQNVMVLVRNPQNITVLLGYNKYIPGIAVLERRLQNIMVLVRNDKNMKVPVRVLESVLWF